MGDDGFAGPPAKKRGATRQISKDDRSDSEEESFVAPESGSFRKASDEVMAGRRVVKVRRPAAAASQGPAAPNPFASICLVPSTTSSGVPPAPVAPASALAPSDELAEKEAVVATVKPTQPGTTDVVEHGVQGEVELAEESIEAIDGITHTPTGGEEEQRHGNGDEKLEMPKSSAIRDNYEDKDKGVGDSDKEHAVNLTTKGSDRGGSGDFQSEENSENSTKNRVDDVNEKITEEKESIVSKEHDTAERRESDAVGVSNVEDDRDAGKAARSSVNAAIPGAFSFGTSPSLFETPTAFASFSSSWTSFGSKTASGTSLGTGFTFASAGSEGAFASASSSFSNSNGSSFQVLSGALSSIAPLNAATSAQPPSANAVQFQGGGITPTGEEEETMVFNADATFFEFIDHSWKERGKGEVRVNVPSGKSGKARLLMRSKGNFRLILNASLFPDIKMTNMDSRGVTFACVNSAVEERTGLTTYALKFKDSMAASNFRDAVDANKSPIQESLNTPGNSPSSLHGP